MIEVREVLSKRDLSDFLLLPWKVYKDDPNWIPPLLLSVKSLLDTKKNPFYQHAKLKMWNAYQGGECVGRLAGVVDDNHNQFHNEKTAFWGFFETVNNIEVPKLLFREVENWARQQGMSVIRGPMSPSSNHEIGLQISAFDTKPYILTPQNPQYYVEFVDKLGFSKAKDLFCWKVHKDLKIDQRIVDVAKRVAKSQKITFRHIDMKNFEKDASVIFSIYNEAWEKNWGFVPLTKEELSAFVKELKPIIVPQLIFIVEVDGDPAGFSVFLPDFNQVMEKIHDGKLFPTGLLKLLWYTKVQKVVKRGRVWALGVKNKYRHLGLAQMMYMTYFKAGPKIGFDEAECGWTLEDNTAMNKGLEAMQATMYKTYRIYDKSLQ